MQKNSSQSSFGIWCIGILPIRSEKNHESVLRFSSFMFSWYLQNPGKKNCYINLIGNNLPQTIENYLKDILLQGKSIEGIAQDLELSTSKIDALERRLRAVEKSITENAKKFQTDVETAVGEAEKAYLGYLRGFEDTLRYVVSNQQGIFCKC